MLCSINKLMGTVGGTIIRSLPIDEDIEMIPTISLSSPIVIIIIIKQRIFLHQQIFKIMKQENCGDGNLYTATRRTIRFSSSYNKYLEKKIKTKKDRGERKKKCENSLKRWPGVTTAKLD